MADDPHARAAHAYAEGDRLHREGQPEAALVRLLEAVALAPDLANARNFAGWLLTTRHRHEPASLAHGIDLLFDAHAHDPADIVPLTNLVEALAAADRRHDARELLLKVLAARPDWPEAWNLSGWLRGLCDGADDPHGAIEDLVKALQLSRWYGDALFNLGRLALATGDHAGALAALRGALASGRCWRPGEATHHLATLEEQRGRLRTALGLYRSAAQLPGEHVAATLAGVQRVGQVLLMTHRYCLHALDEARRQLPGDRPPRPRPVADDARLLLSRMSLPALTAARDAVQVIIDCCEARSLLPRHADRSPALALQLAAASSSTPRDLAPDLASLAVRWSNLQRSLYDDLLLRDEPDPDDTRDSTRLFTLAAHARWDEVRAGLESVSLDGHADLLTRAALAESLADRASRDDDAVAESLYRRAMLDQEATLPTAGKERGEREEDMRRIAARLRGE